MVEVILISVLGGASVALLFMALRDRKEQKGLDRELRRIAKDRLADDQVRESVLREDGSSAKPSRIQKLTGRLPGLNDLREWLRATGATWSVPQFLGMSVCYALFLGMLVNLLVGMPAMSIAAAAGGGLLPTALAVRKRAQRVKKFREQFPETLEMLVRALRVGHPLTTALSMVADDAPEPIASEFRRVSDEQRFGMSFEQSMSSLADRLGSTEARIAVAGMSLQRQVGGNLPEFIERVVGLIRDRVELQRQVQAQTSQGRMSGTVLTLLPVAMGSIITLVSPSYLGAMFESPVGRALLGMSVVLLMIGHVWIQRIVKLKS